MTPPRHRGFSIHIDPALYERLSERAKRNRRAVKDELEIRLEESLGVSDELDEEERSADGEE